MMKIQLALDRLTMWEAIRITQQVKESIDWIEVGTSLIKQFGIDSVKEMKNAFPDKVIVADMKTIDNAKYEFELCFQAGADVATVMGVSPLVTIETCLIVASRYGKKVMIDLLNTTREQQQELLRYKEAIFCDHVSKDEQEIIGKSKAEAVDNLFSNVSLAVAGGITIDSIKGLKGLHPAVAIIGSAITKAEDPATTAALFKKLMEQEREANEKNR
jgi:3-hexulose-6-phosphate synthase